MEAALIAAADTPSLFERWETLVKQNPASGFMQSLHWAKFKLAQKLPNVHVGLFENGRLEGGAIFYRTAANKGAGIMVSPDGPVLPWDDDARATEGLQQIMACAESYANANGQIALRIQPRLSPPALAGAYQFGRAPVDLVPRETLFVDLSVQPEELLMRLKHKTRYNLRLSNKHGVRVYEDCSLEGIAAFHTVLLDAASRDGFYVEPLSFFQALVNTLAPQNMLKLFFAKHEGEIVGTLMLIMYGERATYLYGGIGNRKRHVMAGYALQWHAMMTARSRGCKMYDFYGYDEFSAPGNAYAKFSRFKRGFAGTPVRYIGAHDYFLLDNLADTIVKALGEVSWNEDDVRQSEHHQHAYS